MDISILIERHGVRAYTTVKSEATRISGVHKIRWYGAATRTGHGHEYYSLAHVATGRALNKVPLTADECDRLLDALADCEIEWDAITPEMGWFGLRYHFVNRLTAEALELAGAY
jgi:hypothetical protein